LQLVTHLYKDHLLEEEHFLDWVLKNLDSCPPERLFLWLLLVSIYWQDLTSSRRRSKRLAESLLNHAEKVRANPLITSDLFSDEFVQLYGLDEQSEPSPVLGFLEETIIRLLVTNPVSFLLPKTWDKHGGILHTLSQRRALPQINRVVEDLSTRNRRLLRPSKSPSASTVDSTSRLYRLLDSVDYSISVRIDRLAYDCMELISESSTLISTVLQWASSYYREGSHRVYLVTRLLRRWSHLGADIDDGVLSYLHSMMSNRSNDPCVVFRIIAELVRSKTFSTGRYLQWLIATGSVSQGSDLSAVSSELFFL
jgi:mediator of RNA polymerase II transcription subunit 12